VAIFTPAAREWLRGELISAAQKDPNLCGAAHTGSGASGRLDSWSDIDLALCLKPDASHERVVAAWTELLYRHHAVAHLDIMRGPTLFRVFLLEHTLQVDVAFWRAEDFAAIGPNFLLIFGQAGSPHHTPPPDPFPLIGMAWLYALHVRSSLARGRILQAEYMLSGMRNQVCELTALRCGVNPHQGRGLDDLPVLQRDVAASHIPRSLEPFELKRAFQSTMRALLEEVRHVDGEVATKLSGPLNDMVGMV